MGALLSILAFAALFAVFGSARLADRRSGCHDCAHASDCHGGCELSLEGDLK